jgi:DNA polymerase-4
VRYSDFTTITRSVTLPATRDQREIVRAAELLLERTEAGRRPVRLLGLSVKNFGEADATALVFDLLLPFDPPE